MLSGHTLHSIVSIQILSHLAVQRGLPLADCLRDTAISPQMLADPGCQIRPEQELQVIRNVLSGLDHPPGFGLEAGLHYRLSSYGIWGFALLTSPTYRAAAEIAERFLELSFALVRFRLQSDRDQFHVLLDDSSTPPDLRQFAVERDFAAWCNASQEMQPAGVHPGAVHFRFPRPAYAARFTELCGIEPQFEQASNRIVLDPAMLDAPLPQADPAAARMCLDQCRRLLARRRAPQGLSGQVRELLLTSGERRSLDRVAAQLNLAPRTLRRRLQQEQTSFRAIAGEVMELLATEMLGTTDMTLDEIASRLGYSEGPAFVHAFSTRCGLTPGAYRALQQSRQR